MAAMLNRIAPQKYKVLKFDKRIHLAQTASMVVIHHRVFIYQKLSAQYGTNATQNCLLSANLTKTIWVAKILHGTAFIVFAFFFWQELTLHGYSATT